MNKKNNDNTTASNATSNKHPKVSEMVLLAVAMLNDRKGSSVQAIKKYICSSFNVNSKKILTYIKRYLFMAVASGILIRSKGKGAAVYFRLGGSMKLKMSELLSRVPKGGLESSSSLHSENKKNPNTSSHSKHKQPSSKKKVEKT